MQPPYWPDANDSSDGELTEQRQEDQQRDFVVVRGRIDSIGLEQEKDLCELADKPCDAMEGKH